MRRALEHVLTGAVLLFLGAGLAIVVLNGMDRQSAASRPFDQRSGAANDKAVVRLANPQHQGVTR